MKAKDFRAKSREALTGKWGKAALFTLIYSLITYCISWIANLIPVVGGIANFIITVPLTYGVVATFIKIKRGEEFGYVDFFKEGFSVFSKLWAIIGNVILKLIVPIIILIISIVLLSIGFTGGAIGVSASNNAMTGGFGIMGIIGLIGYFVSIVFLIVKGLYYSLTSYILYDNKELTGKEIVEKSEQLMQGKRGAYFCLCLSFIGWIILAGFTLGIGSLWLIPYMQVALVAFYENRLEETK